ncbi:MAG: adenosylcobinamide-phosphate synthase CbiB [Pseudomonadota bacterium]|nr:adenosylcobinamide-phosphate synthase CbiB [Pseudomonadota bacterium]
MNRVLILALALGLDAVLGEPRRAHPLVAFGRMAQRVERHLYGERGDSWRWFRGVLAVTVLLVPFTLVAAVLTGPSPAGMAAAVVLLYLALGGRSLVEHAARVQTALAAEDLREARIQVSRVVSRDTADMMPTDVSRAAVESVLENGNDAVFGALFWFLLAGAPGAVLYRLANTLDAMWGYRSPRYLRFGWAAARLDDLLNFIPARLTALTYALVGRPADAIRCWWGQARQWDSRNAGAVMASGAGALQLRLGGPAVYQGQLHNRPVLGQGTSPQPRDIARALTLVRHGILLWLAVITAGVLVHA